ncbi:MAG: ABC transporter ATP-binding protein [Chloroflexi bacterium]|nr:ABC transporter ATP-binding protein [Chloroflexota bacterium]
MSDEQPLAVQVQGMHFGYDGRTPVFQGLDLAVARGVSYGLLGPNGAGKTTLLRLVAGRLKPSRGSVLVLGHTPHPSLTRDIGLMPQSSAVYPELTARENVDFFARMYGMSRRGERRERVEEVLRFVELEERQNTHVSRLSGGMRQRVSLACALVHRPPLLLLDEPTVGLDPELRASFWEHFRSMAGEGTTLLISSHTMDDAAHCDRLAFLRSGRVVAEGSPETLRRATGRPDASLEDAFLHFARQEAGDVSR